jgi:hypothetical protein
MASDYHHLPETLSEMVQKIRSTPEKIHDVRQCLDSFAKLDNRSLGIHPLPKEERFIQISIDRTNTCDGGTATLPDPG